MFNSEGNLPGDYREFVEAGCHLVVMPIARMEVEWTARTFPGVVTFYPTGLADLRGLNVISNYKNSSSLAEVSSEASGIDEEVLDRHPLVVFPCKFEWQGFGNSNHRDHLHFITRLSDYVDRTCLNFIRYCQCPIETVDCLPGRAGQVNSNHMMAGALLYNHSDGEARIIGGAAFTHFITRGVGLPLESMDHELFPKSGEVGSIVDNALTLYRNMLEAEDSTTRFIQALSLLEFLAYRDNKFHQSKCVAKVIARYIARDQSEYQVLRDRFAVLNGKEDPETHKFGYRTRLVHMGEHLEDVLPDEEVRKRLFTELGSYTKVVIDHMIKHSEKSWADYLKARESLSAY